MFIAAVTTNAASAIGTAAPPRYPLLGAFFQAPLGNIANADDADRTLARDNGNMAEASFDHRLARFLDRRILGHRDRVRRHPFAHACLTRVHATGYRPHQIALSENSDH